MWTESATRGFHLGTELSKHDSDSSNNLIPTPGFGVYVKLQTWDPTNPRRQTLASDAHPAQPGELGPELGAPSPGRPSACPVSLARLPTTPMRCWSWDSPRPQGPNAAHLQIQPFPISFTRTSAGQLSSSPRLLQARHGLPADLRPFRAAKTFLAQWPPPLPHTAALSSSPCPPALSRTRPADPRPSGQPLRQIPSGPSSVR